MSRDNNSPKILIATADLHPEGYFMNQRYPAIVKALDGCEVSFINLFDFYRDPAKALELASFSGAKLSSYFDHADLIKLNTLFLDHVLSYEWDILCLCSISHYSLYVLPDTIRKLKGEGRLVTCFFGDDEFTFAHNKFWPRLFDAVVAYTEKEVKQYQRWNPYTYLLPVGMPVDIDPSSLELSDSRDIDVLFVGRPYGSRADILTKVRQAGIDLKTYGSKQWTKYPGLRACYLGFLDTRDYWRELSRAKIVLSLMEDWEGKPHINAKVFEAAKVKAMALATYYPPFETTYGLRADTDLVFYHSVEDLINKINYYLEHDHQREAIAENLREKMLDNFTYDKLYRSLFDDLERQWWSGLSGGISSARVPHEKFTVICLVETEMDYHEAQAHWNRRQGLDVIYVSKRPLASCPEVMTVRRFLPEIQSDNLLHDFVLLTCAGVEYDDAVFELTLSYEEAGFLVDGVYYDSLVQGKSYSKSRRFFDLCSSVWRRQAFLANAHTIMGGDCLHKIMLTSFYRFNLAHAPIRINNIINRRVSVKLKLYAWARVLWRKGKALLASHR